MIFKQFYLEMRRLNSEGPPLLGVLADPPPLDLDAFERARGEGAVVLDCRSPEVFAAHILGAINVGIGSSFATLAGSVLPSEQDLVLDRADDLWEVCWQLRRIGYPLPRGWLAGRVDELLAGISSQRPIAVICGSGYRSSVAASVLKARGHLQVAHVLGGMTGWQAEGFETTDTSHER